MARRVRLGQRVRQELLEQQELECRGLQARQVFQARRGQQVWPGLWELLDCRVFRV